VKVVRFPNRIGRLETRTRLLSGQAENRPLTLFSRFEVLRFSPRLTIGSFMRFEATSLEGFVQQVAVSYLRNGYWFYCAGAIPWSKDPREIDRKLVEQYEAGISKHARYRRRVARLATVVYIRHGHFFLLMASKGEHDFFAREKGQIRDARRHPIRVGGYSLSVKTGGKVCVRIDSSEYIWIKNRLLERALSSKAFLEHVFSRMPFEPYRSVRAQLLALLRAVNHKRKRASLPPLDRACVRWRRRIVRPFE